MSQKSHHTGTPCGSEREPGIAPRGIRDSARDRELIRKGGRESPSSSAIDRLVVYLATEYVGGSVHGSHGNIWHVQATNSRLFFTDVNEEWLDEASYFYWAMIESRPDLLTVTDVEELEKSRSLSESDARELRSILDEFDEAMDSDDQEQVDDVWSRLNDFNERSGLAKRSSLPQVPGGIPIAATPAPQTVAISSSTHGKPSR